MNNLTSVHEALKEASLEDRKTTAVLVPISIKAPELLKKEVEFICKNNGTTLSSFLRKCMAALADDYRN